MDVCIRFHSDGERFSWPWQVDGATVGVAIAVVERVKLAVALGTSYPHDPFEHVEPDQKICIHYDSDADTMGVSVRNLTSMQALEGLCEAQYTMQLQWFHQSLALERTN
jgi:hypothetical protein